MAQSKIVHTNPKWVDDLKERYDASSPYDVAVGIPRGGSSSGRAYPDGTPLLNVAYYNEFGTGTTPARPALKLGGRAASKQLKPALIKAIREVNDDSVLKLELGLIGEMAAAIVKKSINDLKSPPNAQSTIQQKKSDNPLVDTGLYRNSVTYQVRKK